MATLEELERRKKELELQRDIARLERNERIGSRASDIAANASNVVRGVSETVQEQRSSATTWSWLWVAPLTLFGLYLVLGGLIDGPLVIALIGLVLLLPAIWKVRGRH